MRKLAGITGALAFLMLPAVAQAKTPKSYVLARPKHQHCRAGYVRKTEKVKKHEHHRTVKIRETLCVRTPPKTPKTPAKTIAPVLPAPAAKTIRLHAHLDPTFVQDPADPFKVTYSYSASATVEEAPITDGAGAHTEPAPLPEGVLSLYSNGSLACAINVGGETTGGECPVTYTVLGAQTVTTIYASGSTSTTETSTETIEPLGTTTAVTASYEALAEPEAHAKSEARVWDNLEEGSGPGEAECEKVAAGWKWCTHETWRVGSLTVATAVTGNASAEVLVAFDGQGDGWADGSQTYPVYVTAWHTSCEFGCPIGGAGQPEVEGSFGSLEYPPYKSVVSFSVATSPVPLEVEAHYAGAGGYAPSEASMNLPVTVPVFSVSYYTASP